MRPMRFALVLIALAVGLSIGPPAAAADPPPKFDIAVSYGYLRDDLSSDARLPLGWVFAVGRNVTGRPSGEDRILNLVIVAEAGGNYKKEGPHLASIHSFLGGVKFAGSRARSAVPFVQILGGIAVFSDAFADPGTYRPLAIQPGVGVDAKMGARSALRIQADYRWVSFGRNDSIGEFRVAIGVVFGVGRG